MIIRGNSIRTGRVQPDYAQTDETRADFIHNKPDGAIAAAQQTADNAKALAQGALPKTGGTMTGPIVMGEQKITGLAAPTESGDGANKDYVDNTVKNARSKATVTLTAAGWSENMQTVAVAGVTADEALTDVIAAPGTADENYAAYVENAVRIYSQNDGSVTFKCEFIPEADIAVNVMVLK